MNRYGRRPCPHCRERVSKNALGFAAHVANCLGVEVRDVEHFLASVQTVTIHGAPQRGRVKVATLSSGSIGAAWFRATSIHKARELLEAAGLIVVDSDPERRHYRRPPPDIVPACAGPHPVACCTCSACQRTRSIRARLAGEVQS